MFRRFASAFGWLALVLYHKRTRHRNPKWQVRDDSAALRSHDTVDPHAIADVILARLAIRENKVLRRKRFLVVITITISLILVATLFVIRPPVPATLRVSQANAFTEFSVTGPHTDQPMRGKAQLRTLDIKLVPQSTPSSGRLLEIIVPVPAVRCISLAQQIGGRCGNEPLPRSLAGGNLDITWTQTAGLTLTTSHVRSLTIRGDATDYATLQVAARATTVATFSCLSPGESFVMTVSGRSFDLQPSCVEPTTRNLHLLFRYGTLPPLTLIRLGRLNIQVPGDTASLHSAQATLNVGGQESFVRGATSFTASVHRSASQTPGFAFASTRDAPGPSVTLTTADASSVRVNGGRERVPTEFSVHQTTWLLLFGVIAGMLVSTAVEILTGRASQDEITPTP